MAENKGSQVRSRQLSAFANDDFGRAAQGADIPATLEAMASGKLAGLVIGVLAHRKPETLGDAIVAHRVGREALDQ